MWKTFQAEFVALWKSRLRFASWIILLFMPLIYGFLFLSSFWSPFKNTEKLPIVVVNLDVSKASSTGHSPESENLVEKLHNHGKPLEFSGGSSAYKINVKDATDLYTTKEQVEEQVNNGKYSGAFVIPQGYGEIISDIRSYIFADIAAGNVNASDLITFVNNEIASANGLIDFYNSFKMSYVAGEMTNMGSSLYRLSGDLLFPDLVVLQPIMDAINGHIPDITSKITQAQGVATTAAISGIINSAGKDTIIGIVNTVNPFITGLATKLQPLLSTVKSVAAPINSLMANLAKLTPAMSAADFKTTMDDLKVNVGELNLALHNLHADEFQTMIKAVKTKVLGDMAKGNLMVDHRTYGKREGVIGKHDILNTYGYGLSPYFLSIVLWAGALLMVFLFPNKRYIKTENTFKNMAGKTAVWVLTGWIQTLLLFAIISIPGIFGSLTYQDINGHDIVIQQCINLGGDQWQLIFFGLFASTMFMLIVRGIVYTIRVADIGLFICVILLILQLVSSGGTFPASMQPDFFKFLHKILPFTYTVDAIREIYWDTDPLIVLKDVGILLIIPAIFTTTSIVSGYFWDKKTHYKRNGKTFYRSMDKNVGSL